MLYLEINIPVAKHSDAHRSCGSSCYVVRMLCVYVYNSMERVWACHTSSTHYMLLCILLYGDAVVSRNVNKIRIFFLIPLLRLSMLEKSKQIFEPI